MGWPKTCLLRSIGIYAFVFFQMMNCAIFGQKQADLKYATDSMAFAQIAPPPPLFLSRQLWHVTWSNIFVLHLCVVRLISFRVSQTLSSSIRLFDALSVNTCFCLYTEYLWVRLWVFLDSVSPLILFLAFPPPACLSFQCLHLALIGYEWVAVSNWA